MKATQSNELRRRALAGGISRRDAWILAIIGYWSQIDGGIQIGPGPKWKWRNYSEFSRDTGYGLKTVQRSVAHLKALGLVDVLRIWNPVKGGQNVNSFRLTVPGHHLLELPCPVYIQTVPADTVNKSNSIASSGPSGNGHYVTFKNTDLQIKIKERSVLLISEEEKKKVLNAASPQEASQVLKSLGKDPDAMIMDVDLVGKLLGYV